MAAVPVTNKAPTGLAKMRAHPRLKVTTAAMAHVALRDLPAKSKKALERVNSILPEPKTEPRRSGFSVEKMKKDLRANDCLYDNRKLWKKLGAGEVPEIPPAVIRKAWEMGGRVVLRCSSISKMTEALREAGCTVLFGGRGRAKQEDYARDVSKPKWIVVQSYIDKETRSLTPGMPAPRPEDWFASVAYAQLEGRHPKGCEYLHAITAEEGTVIQSCDNLIYLLSWPLTAPGDSLSLSGVPRFGKIKGIQA